MAEEKCKNCCVGYNEYPITYKTYINEKLYLKKRDYKTLMFRYCPICGNKLNIP